MLGPVSISIPTLIIEVVVFLALVSIMERMVFTPIRNAWAERERVIQDGLQASSKSREAAEHAKEEVERILAEARRTAQGRIDEGIAAGNKEREQLVTQASEEFRRLLGTARTEIAAQRDQAASGLSERIVGLALQAASRVTGKSYDQPEVRQLAAAVVASERLG